jgi:hypothetical protein
LYFILRLDDSSYFPTYLFSRAEKERGRIGEDDEYCDLKKHIFKLGCRAGLTLMIKLLERHDPKFTKLRMLSCLID